MLVTCCYVLTCGLVSHLKVSEKRKFVVNVVTEKAHILTFLNC